MLLAERHDEVFAALDTPAVGAASVEVLELVVAATGRDAVPATSTRSTPPAASCRRTCA